MAKRLRTQKPVTAGVDTHADFHVAAVVDEVGRVLGTERFDADEKGYRGLLAWAKGFGRLAKVGVEGTGSYGAGLKRHLASSGAQVVEVVRPNRQRRRSRGKSDATDAVSAALAALSGEACGMPKSGDGPAEGVRALQVARSGALKARTQAINELRDLVLTAPEPLHTELTSLGLERRAQLAASFATGPVTGALNGTRAAIASVARRYLELSAEVACLDDALAELVQKGAPPRFLSKHGVGDQVAATLLSTTGDNRGRIKSEASFAALCGASPVDASSGKQSRHRLNRGGDRQANSALWRIVFTRIVHRDPRTMAYLERRTKEGKTRKEIVRCLVRYVAREVYKALVVQARPAGPRESVQVAA